MSNAPKKTCIEEIPDKQIVEENIIHITKDYYLSQNNKWLSEISKFIYNKQFLYCLTFSGNYNGSNLHCDYGLFTSNCYFMKQGHKKVFIINDDLENLPIVQGSDNLSVQNELLENRKWKKYVKYYYKTILEPGDILFFNNSNTFHLFENLDIYTEAISLRTHTGIFFWPLLFMPFNLNIINTLSKYIFKKQITRKSVVV